MTRTLVTTSSPGGSSSYSTLPSGGSSSGSRPFTTARARRLPVQQEAQLERYFPDVLDLGQRIQVRDRRLKAHDQRR
jgi:hypothetical protein